jgi:hypothetical protein
LKRSTFIVLLFSVITYAQISVDEISTDTIDILSNKQDVSLSDKSALWVSLLLPGAGHQIINRNKSALSYISADILSIAGAIFFYRLSDNYEKNYQSLAIVHANMTSSVSNDYFWQIIGSFDSQEAYHETMRLNRDFDDRFMHHNFYWYWEDDLYRKDFLKMQKSSKKLATVSSFFIGALIINRIIAFIDIRTSIQNKYSKKTGHLSVKPYLNPDNSPGFLLSTSF